MKKVIIIGASSGLGMRMAMDFARIGCRVGVAARRDERLKEIKDRFPEQVEYMHIDVTQPDAAERLYQLIELIDGMDILIYAAGCGWSNPELDPAHDQQTIDVNVTGFTRIVTAAYKYFKDTANLHRGRIAVITSVAATKGIGISAAYSASKRYQQIYLQALDQLAHRQQVNVAITDIRPGFIRTPLLDPTRDYPMIMSVDHAAPLIERAVLKAPRVAYIDSRWGIVTGLWRLIPDALWRHISLDLQ